MCEIASELKQNIILQKIQQWKDLEIYPNEIALWVSILWFSIKRIIPIIDPVYVEWASK